MGGWLLVENGVIRRNKPARLACAPNDGGSQIVANTKTSEGARNKTTILSKTDLCCCRLFCRYIILIYFI